MAEYYEYEDAELRARIPAYLRAKQGQRRFGPVRKGKKDAAVRRLGIFLKDPEAAEDRIRGLMGAQSFDWEGAEIRVLRKGPSAYVDEGTDLLLSRYVAIKGRQSYDYELVFQRNGRYVEVSMSGEGSLEGFEEECKKIVSSIQLKTGEAASAPAVQDRQAAATPEEWQAMAWLTCDGGPHLLLPRWLAAEWQGVPEDVVDVLDPETDYGRACQVEDAIGLIRVGDGEALVLHGGNCMAGWGYAPGTQEIQLYVPQDFGSADSDDELVEVALERLTPEQMSDTGWRMTVKSDGLVLLFAGDAVGHAAYSQAEIPAAAGTYRVLQAYYHGPEGGVWIAQLRRG